MTAGRLADVVAGLRTMPAALAGQLSRAAIERAAIVEQAVTHGRAVGLTEDDAREVVDAWLAWDRRHLSPVPWDLVPESMVRRALGERWTPPGF